MDKEKIKKHFSKSAPSYDRFGRLQRWLGLEIIRRIPAGFRPRRILDVGCGTGWLAYKLAKKFPGSQVVAVDIAPGMIKFARQHRRLSNVFYSCQDAEWLDFKPGSFDLVVSSATLQWTDLKEVSRKIKTALDSKGIFLFTTFGPKTLIELKEIFKKGKKASSVHEFAGVKEVLQTLKSVGFKKVSLTRQIVKKDYRNVSTLMDSLKGLGALSAKETSDSSLGRGKELLRIIEKSEEQKSFLVTYEVLIGEAYLTRKQIIVS
ncbi:MAG: malonyl-ACP O-methyltransferase BioC [Candidatus Saganbacteria bacterium]|nr:malonyl-ACP O-methyltransferase BioC [Candidatus Saganbacteria bacterium]